MNISRWEANLQRCVFEACTMEVSATKPGNVSPEHEFSDTTATDFLNSARIVAPMLATAHQRGIGPSILQAVTATHETVAQNTNLGIVLLLSPLAAVPQNQTLPEGIESVLSQLTVRDASDAYRAIALASPGGLGNADSQDVAEEPTMNLRDCMSLAAHRDLIAAQYENGFQQVLDDGVTWLRQTAQWPTHHPSRIAWVAVNFMAKFGDSLIQRKCGIETNLQVKRRADALLNADWPFKKQSNANYQAFDQFLRDDGHRRNPGTTADMIAAVLFAAFRDGVCQLTNTTTQLHFVQ